MELHGLGFSFEIKPGTKYVLRFQCQAEGGFHDVYISQ